MSAGTDVFGRPRACAASSVALVGASERGNWPRSSSATFANSGSGRVALVNPRQTEVYGERCFPSLRELPEPVEHAIVIVPGRGRARCARGRGSRRREVGHRLCGRGRRRRGSGIEEARRLAQGIPGQSQAAHRRPELHGGAQLPRAAVRLSQCGALPVPAPARSAAVFQSGGTLQFWLRSGADRGLRFSYGISSGNEADLDLADYLEFLVDDPQTRLIALFIEGIRRPASLHAGGRPRARSRQADPRDQDRRHRQVAGGCAFTYRRHRRRLCGLSGDVRALRHLQLPLARRHGGDRAGVPGRAVAEGPAHRLRDHVGRHRRSAVRLCRDRRHGHAGIRAATNTALLPYCRTASCRRIRSTSAFHRHCRHAAAVCEVVASDPNVDMVAWAAMLPSKQGAWDGVSAAARPAGQDRQAGHRLRPHELSRCGRSRSPPRKLPASRSCRRSSRRCAP